MNNLRLLLRLVLLSEDNTSLSKALACTACSHVVQGHSGACFWPKDARNSTLQAEALAYHRP